ncbi:hypothetical protein CL633_03605 [bacterium]|nr:hypothetical protein [bacterium]|tara:strand:+ start:1151 stop:2107 length:957 start_codon:yes stop_codon:yes gene_type:complete
MLIILYIILFIILCLVLAKATALVSRALVSLSNFFAWSKFFIGFILMAFVTSLPELIVGISSAISNVPSLSLGNVLGSNIANLTLILGITAVLAGQVSVLRQVTLRSASFLFFIALLPLLLMADMGISRIDGIILLLVFVLYMRFLIKERKSNNHEKEINIVQKPIKSFFKSIGIFVFSAGLLLASAWGITWIAMQIAELAHVPLFIIGIVGVALGTSLPELAFGIFAIWRHEKHGLHLGNLLGSVAINASLILGATAIIRPIKIQFNPSLWTAVIFTVLIIAFFNFFMRTKKKVSWLEGVILIVFYIIFVVLQAFIK